MPGPIQRQKPRCDEAARRVIEAWLRVPGSGLAHAKVPAQFLHGARPQRHGDLLAKGRVDRVTLPPGWRGTRLPVSTPASSGKLLGAGVTGKVVGRVAGPGAPQHARPSARDDADGVRMVAAARAGATVDVSGPGRGVARVVGPGADGLTEAVVARPSEGDAARLPALVGDGTDAGLGGQLVLTEKPFSHVAELSDNLRGVDAPCARERHDDLAFGQFGDLMLDASAEHRELLEVREHHGERPRELALGFGLERTRETDRGLAQTIKQLRDRTTAGVPVLRQECGEAFFAEARRRSLARGSGG